MVIAEVHKLDAYAWLEAASIIQLSFCRRHSINPDWDSSKLLLMHELSVIPRQWKDRIIGLARTESQKPGALEKAIQKLPGQFHESVFYACARIVALQGFEEDISLLAELKEKMKIEDYRAEVMIDLAKGESQMSRLAAKL